MAICIFRIHMDYQQVFCLCLILAVFSQKTVAEKALHLDTIDDHRSKLSISKFLVSNSKDSEITLLKKDSNQSNLPVNLPVSHNGGYRGKEEVESQILSQPNIQQVTSGNCVFFVFPL